MVSGRSYWITCSISRTSRPRDATSVATTISTRPCKPQAPSAFSVSFRSLSLSSARLRTVLERLNHAEPVRLRFLAMEVGHVKLPLPQASVDRSHRVCSAFTYLLRPQERRKPLDSSGTTAEDQHWRSFDAAQCLQQQLLLTRQRFSTTATITIRTCWVPSATHVLVRVRNEHHVLSYGSSDIPGLKHDRDQYRHRQPARSCCALSLSVSLSWSRTRLPITTRIGLVTAERAKRSTAVGMVAEKSIVWRGD